MTKLLFTFSMIFVLLQSYFSQESINSSGSNISSSSGKVSFSVGQVMYQQQMSSSCKIEQGVQHAYEILNLSTNDLSLLQPKLFPNPTANYLVLQLIDKVSDKIYYKLKDANGKLINEVYLIENQSDISVSHLDIGTYFLELYDQNSCLQTFKFIKY